MHVLMRLLSYGVAVLLGLVCLVEVVFLGFGVYLYFLAIRAAFGLGGLVLNLLLAGGLLAFLSYVYRKYGRTPLEDAIEREPEWPWSTFSLFPHPGGRPRLKERGPKGPTDPPR